jgi:two-component system invasion response regulator UvrY
MDRSMEDLGDGLPGGELDRPVVRILLVDDNEDFRRQAARFLASVPGCRVDAFASSGREALEISGRDDFDLILIDLSMPGMGGFEATQKIKERPLPPRVVILSLGGGDAYRIASEAAKADGFLSKLDFTTQIASLIERLFPGRQSQEKNP